MQVRKMRVDVWALGRFSRNHVEIKDKPLLVAFSLTKSIITGFVRGFLTRFFGSEH